MEPFDPARYVPIIVVAGMSVLAGVAVVTLSCMQRYRLKASVMPVIEIELPPTPPESPRIAALGPLVISFDYRRNSL